MSISLGDTLLLTTSVFIIGIFILKLYNVMHKGQKFNVVWAVLCFIMAIIIKYIGLVTLLNNYNNILYLSIHNILNLIYIAIWFFFIVEVVFFISNKAAERSFKPTKPDYDKSE